MFVGEGFSQENNRVAPQANNDPKVKSHSVLKIVGVSTIALASIATIFGGLTYTFLRPGYLNSIKLTNLANIIQQHSQAFEQTALGTFISGCVAFSAVSIYAIARLFNHRCGKSQAESPSLSSTTSSSTSSSGSETESSSGSETESTSESEVENELRIEEFQQEDSRLEQGVQKHQKHFPAMEKAISDLEQYLDIPETDRFNGKCQLSDEQDTRDRYTAVREHYSQLDTKMNELLAKADVEDRYDAIAKEHQAKFTKAAKAIFQIDRQVDVVIPEGNNDNSGNS